MLAQRRLLRDTGSLETKPATVPSRDPKRVREMFGRIAVRYDLANHVLSGGVDFLWRARAARMVERWEPRRVLDLATGSGDLAVALQRRLPESEIVAVDFAPEMLAIARAKGVRVTAIADALNLPFDAGSFDCITVAFGLRNMSDWGAALREMRRVLTSSGHLLVLDFSRPVKYLRPLYGVYLHGILPLAAAALTGQKGAYEYLASSIDAFPSGIAMADLINRSGFTNTVAMPLTGGIATIYTAEAGN